MGFPKRHSYCGPKLLLTFFSQDTLYLGLHGHKFPRKTSYLGALFIRDFCWIQQPSNYHPIDIQFIYLIKIFLPLYPRISTMSNLMDEVLVWWFLTPESRRSTVTLNEWQGMWYPRQPAKHISNVHLTPRSSINVKVQSLFPMCISGV